MECDRMVECHYINANNKSSIQHYSIHFRDRFSAWCKLRLRSHFVPSRTFSTYYIYSLTMIR
jgi:hypothetical protein